MEGVGRRTRSGASDSFVETGPDKRGCGWSECRDFDRIPGQIGPAPMRPASRWRDQVRCPIFIQSAAASCAAAEAKRPKRTSIIGPIRPEHRRHRIAWTVVELRAQQHVDRHAILG